MFAALPLSSLYNTCVSSWWKRRERNGFSLRDGSRGSECLLERPLTALWRVVHGHEAPGTQVDVGGGQGAGRMVLLGATGVLDAQAEEGCWVHLKSGPQSQCPCPPGPGE